MRVEEPLFGLGLQGKSPNVTANSLVNAYYEFQKEKDRTRVAIYGTPGLTLFIDQGDTPWRGLHAFPSNSLLYGVHRGTFYDINNAGTRTSRGTIGTTTGRVDIEDDGTIITVVDGSEIYTYDTSSPATPIAAVADAQRPTSPNTCIFHKQRILTDENLTGQIKGAALTDPTDWAALDFFTAESKPDNVVRIINYRGTVVAFGDYTIEFWQLTTGSGFPYVPVTGAEVEYGLAARWSVAQFGGTFAFLAKNREGQVIVSILNGYNVPTRISNNELDHLINNYSTVGDATGYGYMLGGHPMYQLNFPTAGKSWLYDGSTRYWSPLQYKADERHRAEFGVDYLNQTIVADYSNGKLYKLESSAYTDNGENIHMILTGKHLANMKKKVKFMRLELGFEPATTTDHTLTPVAHLEISKDGGHSFGTKVFAYLGKVGEYLRRCTWRNMGSGRDIVPRVTITDPVKRVITEATLVIEDGMS